MEMKQISEYKACCKANYEPYYNEFLPEQGGKEIPSLTYIPAVSRTREMCLFAVEQDFRNMAYVPEEVFNTENFVLDAIRANGLALGTLDFCHISPEICYEAVRQNKQAIMYVPIWMRSEQICRASLGMESEFSAAEKNKFMINWTKNRLCDAPYEIINVPENLEYFLQQGLLSHKTHIKLEENEKKCSSLQAICSLNDEKEALELIKILFEHGGTANDILDHDREEEGGLVFSSDINIETPLIIAIKSGNYRIANLLIDKGADLRPKDRGYGNDHFKHMNPLDYAIEYENYDLAKLLVNNGCKLASRDCIFDSLEKMEFCYKHDLVNPYYSSKIPLHYAIYRRKTEEALLLMKYFPEMVEDVDRDGNHADVYLNSYDDYYDNERYDVQNAFRYAQKRLEKKRSDESDGPSPA